MTVQCPHCGEFPDSVIEHNITEHDNSDLYPDYMVEKYKDDD